MLQDIFHYITTEPSPDLDPVRAAALNAMQALAGSRPFLFPDFLPERTPMPAGRYSLINNEQGYTLEGDPFDFASLILQFDWYGATPEQRDTMGDKAKIALGGYIGTMGGTSIGILMFESEQNGYESTPLLYSRMQTYKVLPYSDDSAFAPSVVPGIYGASRHEPVEPVDEIRTSFTFIGIPTDPARYLVAINGLVTCQGFTQDGDVLTFDSAPSDLCVFY